MRGGTDVAYQRCISPACQATFSVGEAMFECPRCGELLDVVYDWDRCRVPRSLSEFEAKWADRADPLNLSGVWRFRELLPFAPPEAVQTLGEGQTILQKADRLAPYVDMKPGHLFLQYEGLNPSGSFKDNGMTAAFTHARLVGAKRAACASTGNTSASLAMFSAVMGTIRGIIFVGSGKIAYGKLAQALDHGALTVQITGDFDDAMMRVREAATKLGMYLMNSLNPFRLEGQKAIMYRVLESLRWQVPDWIVVPGGNLGNSSAFGKAFMELLELGLIDRAPKLAIINASGARTMFELADRQGLRWDDGQIDDQRVHQYYAHLDAENIRAHTVASAIEINRPVNLRKALRSLAVCGGVVRHVSDQDILDAKAKIASGGLGCEPASAASVAGARQLRAEGIIAEDDLVVCILTGHLLKDPSATVGYHSTDPDEFRDKLGRYGLVRANYANRAVVVPNDLTEIIKAIEVWA